MNAKKLQNLYKSSQEKDKEAIKLLVTKLNGLIQNDANAKKAASLLQNWLKEKGKQSSLSLCVKTTFTRNLKYTQDD